MRGCPSTRGVPTVPGSRGPAANSADGCDIVASKDSTLRYYREVEAWHPCAESSSPALTCECEPANWSSRPSPGLTASRTGEPVSDSLLFQLFLQHPLFRTRLGSHVRAMGFDIWGVDDSRSLARLGPRCILGGIPSGHFLERNCGLPLVDRYPTDSEMPTHQHHPPTPHSHSRQDEQARP